MYHSVEKNISIYYKNQNAQSKYFATIESDIKKSF